MWRLLLAVLRLPIDHYLAALTRLAAGWDAPRLAVFLAVAVASWWIYVPLHELAHALGCVLGGGSVTRLDLDPIYGAALLQRVLPFVHVGSAYAGQLAGFDTRGSDVTYLLTDGLPFAATVLVGVPMLVAAGQPGRAPLRQAALFGASLPIAFAPFISLIGDYYEMGSILVSRAVAVARPGVDPGRWRSDDLFLLIEQLFGAGGGDAFDAVLITLAALLGTALAVLTYAAGAGWARLLGIGRASPPEPATHPGTAAA